jgi:RND family efflux transporter MFP subunit
MKKLLTTLLILAAVGVLGVQIYRKAASAPAANGALRNKPPVAVEIAPVEVASIQDIGRYTGSLYPASEFVVAPKISGRIEEIEVRMGDPVAAGQLIAVLDDDEYRQQVAQAAAELDVARATVEERRNTLENTRREYERTVALREKKIASQSELDAAEADYHVQQARFRVAGAQVAQKAAALKAAEVQLAYTRIRVPENHNDRKIVGERFLDPGAMVAANTPIVSILDINTLTAKIYVIERDYPMVRTGMTAELTCDAFADRRFTGRVSRVSPLLKEASRQASVEIEVANDDLLLKPGMFVRVEIALTRHDDATVVPLAALVTRNGQTGVFAADMQTMTARFIPVTVGITDSVRAEIVRPELSGQVVTLGHHLLEDGAAMRLPANGSPAKAQPKAG